jgi:DNA polymerase bacteriophage-type
VTIPSVMEACANAMRGVLIAPPGRKLVASDLSNIEGRGLAWLAGEEWKLDAFRAYDAGTGPDLYKLAYARAFRIEPSDVDKYMRQIGKVMELALGYEGGVGAFLNMAAVYGLDLDALAEKAWPTIPDRIREEATGAWEWACRKRRTYGLSERVYMVCDALKRMWREAHPATTAMWRAFQDCAAAAILDPGSTHCVGRCEIGRVRNWLRIKLPSGRYLCYPSARVDENGKISYMGVNQWTRQWSRIGTYSGKFAENVTQAVARDVLADAMPRAEAAGYEIVLTVHDELLCEVPDSPEFSADGLSQILATNPSWADGLPLAAAGFEGYRYGKH